MYVEIKIDLSNELLYNKMELAYTEIWSRNFHGYIEGQAVNPEGHILLHTELTFDDFIEDTLNNESYYPSIDLVEEYRIGEYSFAIVKTVYIRILQRKFRKWLKTLRLLKSPTYLHLRRINGKYP